MMNAARDVWTLISERGMIEEAARLFAEVKAQGVLDGQAVRNLYEELAAVWAEDSDLVRLLLTDVTQETYLAMQSVKVASVSYRLAQALRYPEAECLRVGLAGLVHDIGMASVDCADALDKPRPLDAGETESMREHCLYGYELVRTALKDERISLVALQHHERLSGLGYPNGFTGGQIHPYAKIVAIADVCCAMTTDRPHRTMCNPLKALLDLHGMSQQELDPYMVKVFIRSIMPYFYGKTIMLSDGSSGTIAAVGDGILFRPLVRVGDRDVDLSRTPGLQIVDLIA